MNFDAIAENLPMYLEGALITLKLLLLSLACGLALALPLAVVRTVSRGLASRAVWVYTYVFRGTPMLVQLFLVYYGLAQFDTLSGSLLPPAVFLGINMIESQFVTPTVVGHRSMLNPFIVLLSVVFWIWL